MSDAVTEEPTEVPSPSPSPMAASAMEASAERAPSASAVANERPTDFYEVSLDMFEGPLDLLLHLVKKHELPILDIPIAFITERYLAYLDRMQHLNVEVATRQHQRYASAPNRTSATTRRSKANR